MAAPVPAWIRLADDAALAGARMRTQTRDVAAVTVHEHFGADVRDAAILTVQTGVLPSIAAVATAHASTAGFLWLLNPVGSTRLIKLRRCEFAPSVAALSLALVYVTLERMTFTGTHTGATILNVPAATCNPAPVAVLASNTTGITPSTVEANAPLFAFWLTPAITAANTVVPKLQSFEPLNVPGRIVLEPGEGLVLRQPVNGNTAMRLNANLAWDEVEA